MILWLILTAMTLAAAAYVAAPFLRPIDRAGAEQSSEFNIYRDQLAEIDREAAAGSIEPAAAEQARAEVKRRMLAADKAAAGASAANPLTALEYKFAFVAVTALTVLGSAILYAYNGAPGLASATPGTGGMAAAQQGGDATPGAVAAPANPSAALSSVEAMITKLALRLKANPNDSKGWSMLGWSYMSTGKYAEAIESYKKSVDTDGKSANARVGLADALIQAAQGKVTPEAGASIDQALALDAKEPRALFLRGLGKSQAGDAKAAIEDWIVVLGLARADEQWAPEVRQKILDLAKEANIDVAGRLPAIATAAAPPMSAPAQAAPAATPLPGPSAAEVAAAQGMSETDRMAMVKGMVERLAAKLEASPRNADGWVQLMRSRKVLGDVDGAKAALKKSLGVFADSPADQDKLKAAAGDLGLGS